MFFSKFFKKKQEPEKVKTFDDVNAESPERCDEIDEELIAVITAAIQSSVEYDPHSRLMVKSIVRTGQATPVWNRTSRLERLDTKL